MRFITNFNIKDIEKYHGARSEWEHGKELTINNNGRDGSPREGSLYCSDKIKNLSPFWRIFESLESA